MAMRIFFTSLVAVAALAMVAALMLGPLWEPADQAFSSKSSVRFPHEENGHNLVGKSWQSARDH
jgi:hypothetical protein